MDTLSIITGGLAATPPRQLARRWRLARAHDQAHAKILELAGTPAGRQQLTRLAPLASDPRAGGHVQQAATAAVFLS